MKKWLKWFTLSLAVLSVCVLGLSACGGEKEDPPPTYPEVPAPKMTAKKLNVIDTSDMTNLEWLTVTTVQGVVSNLTDEQIYITSRSQPSYDLWLTQMQTCYGVTTQTFEDPWTLLKKYETYLTGYILCDYKEHSLNVATSYAGVKRAAVVTTALEESFRSHMNLDKSMDACGLTEDQVFTREVVERDGFSKTVAFEQSYKQNEPYIRDMITMTGGVTFYVGIGAEREAIMEAIDLEEDGFMYGFGDVSLTGFEDAFIDATSKHGINYIPYDQGMNYSVLSGFSLKDESMNLGNKKTVDEYETDVHYVTFMMSDGDNLQLHTNMMFNETFMDNTSTWMSPYRGQVPLMWGIPPTMCQSAPMITELEYETFKASDSFVMPDSASFIFPGSYPETALKKHTQRLADYSEKMDIGTTYILGMTDYTNPAREKMWEDYLEHDSIDGLFYFEWGKVIGGLDALKGDIKWVFDKPILTCNGMMFNDQQNADLVRQVNAASRDVTKPGAYTLVYVNAWAPGDRCKAVADVVAQFGSDVRVVNGDQMIDVIKHNVKR